MLFKNCTYMSKTDLQLPKRFTAFWAVLRLYRPYTFPVCHRECINEQGWLSKDGQALKYGSF